ncbi:MAG: hypothetical protein RL100_994 [Actinomycetota bacterium]|jgi:hypothetical protein
MFELTMLESFGAEAIRTLSVCADTAAWPVVDKPRVMSNKFPQAKLAFDDFSRAVLNVAATEQGCQLQIRHELIADQATATARQEYWQQVIVALHERLDV